MSSALPRVGLPCPSFPPFPALVGSVLPRVGLPCRLCPPCAVWGCSARPDFPGGLCPALVGSAHPAPCGAALLGPGGLCPAPCGCALPALPGSGGLFPPCAVRGCSARPYPPFPALVGSALPGCARCVCPAPCGAVLPGPGGLCPPFPALVGSVLPRVGLPCPALPFPARRAPLPVPGRALSRPGPQPVLPPCASLVQRLEESPAFPCYFLYVCDSAFKSSSVRLVIKF